MVNVGGRSKGCTTCRRRRIKCDETSPICKRCARHGLQCSGPQTTTFIISTVNSRKTHGRSSGKPNSFTGSQDLLANLPPQTTYSLKQNDREVYICFVRQRLLPDGPLYAALGNTKLNDIMTIGQVSGTGGPVFDATVLSFATILFGAEHNEARILARGYATYDIALGRLNEALSDAKRCVEDDVIVSVIALVILECLVPTSPKSYLNQMLGLERLIDLRYQTSGRFSNQESMYLYRCVRPLIMFASLRATTPSIFARPDWKQLFRIHSSSATVQAENLWELLADCTVLVAQCNRNATCQTQDVEQGDIISRALVLQSSLHLWKKTWDMTNEAGIGISHATNGEGLDYGLGMFSTSTVITPLVYYTTLIHLNIVLASLTGKQLGTDHDLEAGRQAALRIVHSLPHHLNPKESSQRYALPVVQWAAVTAFQMLGGEKTIEGKNLMQMLRVADTPPTRIAPGIWEE